MKRTKGFQRHWQKELTLGVLLSMLTGSTVWAATQIVPTDSKYNNTVTTKGNVTNVTNQQIVTFPYGNKGSFALNKFKQFNVEANTVANMQLGNISDQLNLIYGSMTVNGMLNAIKDNKIGGNVIFAASNGINIGSTGIINAQNLGLIASSKFDNVAAGAYPYGLAKNFDTTSAVGDADGSITVNGIINTSGGFTMAARNITIGQTGVINARGNFTATIDNNWQAADYTANLVNTNALGSAQKVVKQADGSVTLHDGTTKLTNDVKIEANKNITLNGTVLTNGGDFLGTVYTDSDARKEIKLAGSTGKISTRVIDNNSTFDNHLTDTSIGDSGNLTLYVTRSNMGTSTVDLGAMKIVSYADGNTAGTLHQGGSTFIGADATTSLDAWAQLEDKTVANVTLTATNVKAANLQVAAYANNQFSLKDHTETKVDNQGNVISGAGKFSMDGEVFGSAVGLTDALKSSRILAVGSHVLSDAKVTIKPSTSLETLGNAALDSKKAALARDINISAASNSGTAAADFGMIASVVVGISEADANVDIDNSTLKSADNLKIKAVGENSVSLRNYNLGTLGSKVPVNLALNYAQLDDNIKANVKNNSVLSAGQNIAVSADLTRTMVSVVSNTATEHVLGAAAGVLISNTMADASVLGTNTTAGGDVKVTANNQPVQHGSYYEASSNIVYTTMGESFTDPAVDAIVGGISKVGSKLKSFLTDEAPAASVNAVTKTIGDEAGMGLAIGVNKLTDKASASLGGTVTAKSVDVEAATVERPKNLVNANVGKIPDSVSKESREKAAALAVTVDVIDGTATASVADNSKLFLHNTGDVTVKADMKVPYETIIDSLKTGDLITIGGELAYLIDDTLGVDDFLFDNWARSSAVGDDFALALSGTVIDYTNTAKASIGEGVTITDVANVKVNADADITTVNLSGIFQSPIKNFQLWKKDDYQSVIGNSSNDAAGGSALSSHYVNTASATIGKENSAQKTTITASGDVNVNAAVKATDITVAATGSSGKTIAIDGAVAVDRISDTTIAAIYNSTVNAGNGIKVNAEDNSNVYNLAIAADKSEKVGVGATIAYNAIARDTQAHLTGDFTAGKTVQTTASNAGNLITATAAGTLVKDTPKQNTAAEEANESAESIPLDDLAENPLDTISSAAGSSAEESNALSALNGGADGAASVQNQASGGRSSEGAGAKSGYAIAGSVSINKITDTAKAQVGSANVATTITAPAAKIQATNKAKIVAVSLDGALNLNSGKQGATVAGAFMLNELAGSAEASINNSTLNFASSLQDANGPANTALLLKAANDNEIVSVAASVGGAANSVGVAGQVAINKVDDTTTSQILNSNVYADKDTTIEADDTSRVYGVGGGATYTGGAVGVGASVVVDLASSTTTAKAQDSSFAGYTMVGSDRGRGGNLSVLANEQMTAATVAVSGAVSADNQGFAGAFSAAGTRLKADTTASLLGSGSKVKNDTVTVAATDASALTAASGDLALSKTAAVGIAATVTVNRATTDAKAGGGMDIDATNLYVTAGSALNQNSKDTALKEKNISLASDDTDTIAMAKTVAVGVGGSTGAPSSGGAGSAGAGGSTEGTSFTGVGSAVVNNIKRTANASIVDDETSNKKKNNLTISDTMQVKAVNATKLFGLAGSFGATGKGVGLGAAADVAVLTNTTKATVSGNTKILTGNVTVAADSKENLVTVAAGIGAAAATAGIGAAADVHVINTDTEATISDMAEVGSYDTATGTVTNRAGAVEVTAEDTSDTKVNAASAGLSFGAGVGAGAASATDVINKNILANIGKGSQIYAKNIAVKATENDGILTTANGVAGAVTVALEGSVSVSNVKHTITADVGNDATINAQDSTLGNIDVSAINNYTHVGETGSVSISGTAAGGAGVDVNHYVGKTYAYSGSNDILIAENLVGFQAKASEKSTEASVQIAGSGGAAGGGNVIVNNISGDTEAFLGNTNRVAINRDISAPELASKNYGLLVNAEDTSDLGVGAGGISISQYGSVGGSVLINNLSKKTFAFVSDNSSVDTAFNQKITATNKEKIISVGIQAVGALYGALSGAVNVNNLSTVTQAFAGNGVSFNQSGTAYSGKGTKSTLDISALHNLEFTSTAVNAGLSAVTVGGAVDVANFRGQTAAYLGSNSKVYEAGKVSINSTDDAKSGNNGVTGTVVAASVGMLGVEGAVSVYHVDDTSNDSSYYSVNGSDATDAALQQTKWDNLLVGLSKTQGDLAQQIKTDNGSTAAGEKDGTVITAAPKGTSAFLGNNTTVKASTLDIMATNAMNLNTKAGDGVAALLNMGAVVNVVRNSRDVSAYTGNADKLVLTSGNLTAQSKRDQDVEFTDVGATLTIGSVTDVTYSLKDKGSSLAALGSSNKVYANDSITIQSDNIRNISGTAVGAGLAVVDAGPVTIDIGVEDSTSDAHIGLDAGATDYSDIQAGVDYDETQGTGKRNSQKGNVTVAATTQVNADTKAVAPILGLGLAVPVTVNNITDTTTTKTYLGNKEAISKAGAVTFTAKSTPKLSTASTSAGVGMIAVGVVSSNVKDKETVNAGVKAEGVITADSINITAETAMPTTGNNVYVEAAAGSGGAINASSTTTDVTIDDTVKTDIAKATNLKAKSISLSALNKSRFNMKDTSIEVGLAAGGSGARLKADITANTGVTIAGADTAAEGANLLGTYGGIAIVANSTTERGWLTGTDGITYANRNANVGAGGVGGGGNISSDTTITHNTDVAVGKNAVLTGIAPVDTRNAYYTNNALTIDVGSSIKNYEYLAMQTGSVVGGVTVNTSGTHANNYNVNSKLLLDAGSTVRSGYADLVPSSEKTAAENEALALQDTMVTTNTYGATNAGGGNIALGVRNDADVISSVLGQIWGAVGGVSVANKHNYTGTATLAANGTMETTVGDITLAAGKDSSGKTGTIKLDIQSKSLSDTLVPTGATGKPEAYLKSTAAITADEQSKAYSDRHINLLSNFGTNSVTVQGENRYGVFVDNTKETTLQTSVASGTKGTNENATVVFNGTASTGIHRNRTISIGGKQGTEVGTWETSISRNPEQGYSFTGNFTASSELVQRWNDLQELMAKYATDTSALAGYEAESRFIEAKLYSLGMGAYDNKTGKFMLLESGTVSDYDSNANQLASLAGSVADFNAYKTSITTQSTALSTVQDKYNAYVTAKNNDAAASTPTTQATLNQAMQSLHDAIVSYNEVAASSDQLASGTASSVAVTADDLSSATASLTEQQTFVKDYDADSKDLQLRKTVSDLFYSSGGTSELDKTAGQYVFKLNGNAITTDAQLQTALGSYIGSTVTAGDLVMSNLLSKVATDDVSVGRVLLDDVTATRGNIKVEGTSLAGSGSLKANADAVISINNTSPNIVEFNDLTVTDGGKILFNNVKVKNNADITGLNSGGTVASFKNLTYQDSDPSQTPTIDVESTFNTGDYINTVTDSNTKQSFVYKVYAAPSLTLAKTATVSNEDGLVKMHSLDGDINVFGAVNGGVIKIDANNGDFIQGYTSGTKNIGGDPETLYNDGHWGVKDAGIVANGNIYINAQYLNVNGTIQSGVADWQLNLADNMGDLLVNYQNGSTKGTKKISELTEAEKAYTLTLDSKYGNMASMVTYNAQDNKLLVDGVNVRGGSVELVGTIMNTGAGQENGAVTGGSILALDGYGKINLVNNSGLTLEIRSMSNDTGTNGTEGSVIITDIDRSGSTAAVSSYKYTRENNVQRVYKQQADKTWSDVTATYSPTSYSPKSGLTYTKMSGTSQTKTVTYEEKKKTFNIFGDWGTISSTDPDAKAVGFSTSENLNLPQHPYINYGTPSYPTGVKYLTQDGKATESATDTAIGKDVAGNLGGSYLTKRYYRIYANNTVKSANKVTSKRILVVKTYTYHWDETTGVSNYASQIYKADNPIKIGFVGTETPGSIDIVSNGTINLAGSISNPTGNITLLSNTGADINAIKSTAMLTADSVELSTTGNIGSSTSPIKTNTGTLLSQKASTNLYVQDIDAGGLKLGSDLNAQGIVSLQSSGSIDDTDQHTINAKRMEVTSEGGGVGTAAAPLLFATGAPVAGKDAAYGVYVKAQNDINLSTTGKAMVDTVSSNNGDVKIYAKEGIYDNNTNESTNQSVAAKLLSWQQHSVLEGSEELLSRQKLILQNQVKSEYNEYQYLHSQQTKGASLSAAEQAEYDRLQAKGVGQWTRAVVEGYTPVVDKTQQGATYAYNYVSDGFLTATEQQKLLQGTGNTENSLLLSLSPGLTKETTDTNPVVKEYANVKGNNVSLLTGATVGDKSATKTITLDLTQSLKSYADTAEGSSNLLALATAERGDVSLNQTETQLTANLQKVSPVEVEAKGIFTTTFVDDSGSAKAPTTGNNVFVVSESNDALQLGNIAGNEVRFKTTGDLLSTTNTNVSALENDLVLEAANGNIDVTIGAAPAITARAGGNIILTTLPPKDMVIDSIYTTKGVILNSNGTNILALNGTGTDNLVNIEAGNVQLNGNSVGDSQHSLGLQLTDPSSASNINGTNGMNLYLAGSTANFAQMLAANGDIVATGPAALTADTVQAGKDLNLQLGAINIGTANAVGQATLKSLSGGLQVNSLSSNTAQLAAATDLTAGTITTTGNASLEAKGDLKATEIKSAQSDIEVKAGTISKAETLEATQGNIKVTTTTANIGNLTAGQDITVHTTTSSMGNLAAGQNIAVDTTESTMGNLTAGQDITVHTTTSSMGNLAAGQNIAVDTTESTMGNLTAGQDIAVHTTTSSMGDLAAGQNIAVTTTEGTMGNLTAGQDIAVQTTTGNLGNLSAGQNIAVTTTEGTMGNLTAGQYIAVHTTIGNMGDMTAGQNITVGTTTGSLGNLKAGQGVRADSTVGALTVNSVNADYADLRAQTELTVGPIEVNGNSTMEAGDALHATNVISYNDNINATAGNVITADLFSAQNGSVKFAAPETNIKRIISGNIVGNGGKIYLPDVSYSGPAILIMQLQGLTGNPADHIDVHVSQSPQGVIYRNLNMRNGTLANSTYMAALEHARISGDGKFSNDYLTYDITKKLVHSAGPDIAWLQLLGRGVNFDPSTYIYYADGGTPLNGLYFYDTVYKVSQDIEKHHRDWWNFLQPEEARMEHKTVVVPQGTSVLVRIPPVNLVDQETI